MALAVAFYFVQPAPPKKIVMASGKQEGRYGYYAKLYQPFLAKNGVTLELHPSSGAIQKPGADDGRASGVDVGFVQSGTGFSANAPDLVSLGSLYFEPLWVFYRGKPITDLDGLRGRRIAIGVEESGTRALALQSARDEWHRDATDEAYSARRQGGRGAAHWSEDRRIDGSSPSRFRADRAAGVDARDSSAQLRSGRCLHQAVPISDPVDPAAGCTSSLATNIPAHEVALVSPTANLIARKDLHPALAYLLMRAATEIHGAPACSTAKAVPCAADAGFPLSEQAKRYYNSGPPFLQRYLPFWAANLVDRCGLSSCRSSR